VSVHLQCESAMCLLDMQYFDFKPVI